MPKKKTINICQLLITSPDDQVRVVSPVGWSDAATLALNQLGYPATNIPDFDAMKDPRLECERWITAIIPDVTCAHSVGGFLPNMAAAIAETKSLCESPVVIGSEEDVERFWIDLTESLWVVAAPESVKPGRELPPGMLMKTEYMREPELSNQVDRMLGIHHLAFDSDEPHFLGGFDAPEAPGWEIDR